MPAKPKPTRAERPKKSKRVTKIAIDNADRYFSLCVRERADWICFRCHKVYERDYASDGLPKNQGFHCSHFYGRANKSVRWDGDNAEGECYFCHTFHEMNPYEFTEYTKTRLGPDRFDALHERSLDMDRGRDNNLRRAEIAEHYKTQLELMLKKREQGFVGRLEFLSW